MLLPAWERDLRAEVDAQLTVRSRSKKSLPACLCLCSGLFVCSLSHCNPFHTSGFVERGQRAGHGGEGAGLDQDDHSGQADVSLFPHWELCITCCA